MSDLISRSALIKKIRDYADEVGCVRGEYELANGILKAISVVEDAPTVEAKPVVYGKWNIGSKPRCSVCGKSALREYDRDDWLSYVPSDFCPHCGADMRGEKHD